MVIGIPKMCALFFHVILVQDMYHCDKYVVSCFPEACKNACKRLLLLFDFNQNWNVC
jgi:hypothetical protein